MTFWNKFRSSMRWLPAYVWQRTSRPRPQGMPLHFIIGLADHFEPEIIPGAPGTYASRDERERRVERWFQAYPGVVDRWRDSDGRPFRHTYFYPAEQYDRSLVERLAEHCHAGWGEVEVQLHHGLQAPDTAENLRRTLVEYRDRLVGHGCLSRFNGEGPACYAFVHGNWTLGNSGNGRYCGVDEELQVLAETGCYADFTLPSAPNPAQVGKINVLYECALPLNVRVPHRRGRDLRSGSPPRVFPLIVQGPLMLDFSDCLERRFVPRIENSEVAKLRPPTMQRLKLWWRAGVRVKGRPEWVFIKLHCHGMDPRDEEVMLGGPMPHFLEEMAVGAQQGGYRLHYVTAREMVNIILAACDGRGGDPHQYRDYRIRLIRPPAA